MVGWNFITTIRGSKMSGRKEVLYWTIRSEFLHRCGVFAVTSEKKIGMYTIHLYGTNEYGQSSNCNQATTYGKFKTKEEAVSVVDAYIKIKEKHKPNIDAANIALRKVTEAEAKELAGYLMTIGAN